MKVATNPKSLHAQRPKKLLILNVKPVKLTNDVNQTNDQDNEEPQNNTEQETMVPKQRPFHKFYTEVNLKKLKHKERRCCVMVIGMAAFHQTKCMLLAEFLSVTLLCVLTLLAIVHSSFSYKKRMSSFTLGWKKCRHDTVN